MQCLRVWQHACMHCADCSSGLTCPACMVTSSSWTSLCAWDGINIFSPICSTHGRNTFIFILSLKMWLTKGWPVSGGVFLSHSITWNHFPTWPNLTISPMPPLHRKQFIMANIFCLQVYPIHLLSYFFSFLASHFPSPSLLPYLRFPPLSPPAIPHFPCL